MEKIVKKILVLLIILSIGATCPRKPVEDKDILEYSNETKEEISNIENSISDMGLNPKKENRFSSVLAKCKKLIERLEKINKYKSEEIELNKKNIERLLTERNSARKDRDQLRYQRDELKKDSIIKYLKGGVLGAVFITALSAILKFLTGINLDIGIGSVLKMSWNLLVNKYKKIIKRKLKK